jgi:hypothetical protein
MAVRFLAGEYVANITDWGLGESRNKKTPQFIVRFRILGKINPNEPLGQLMQCPTDERTLYLYITPKTKDMFERALGYLGYDRDSFRFLNRNIDGAHDFLGKEINVRCEHEDYEGSINERWSLSIPSEIKPLDDMRIMELDSMFGKSGGSKTPSRKSNGSKKSEPATADEVPF